jgi:hypothetical protein
VLAAAHSPPSTAGRENVVETFHPDVGKKVVCEKLFRTLCRKSVKFLSAENVLSTVKPSARKRPEKIVRKNVCGEKLSSDNNFDAPVFKNLRSVREPRVIRAVSAENCRALLPTLGLLQAGD